MCMTTISFLLLLYTIFRMTIYINLKLDSGQTQFAGSQCLSMQNSFHKYCNAKLSIGIFSS